MKKIIFSLAIIGAAAALVIGGTTAYFSDAETSNNNGFTAGSIDLSLGGQFSSAHNGSSAVALNPNINGQALYSFTDLKPGDTGGGTFNLQVNSNDAYVCAKSTITSEPENGLTDPEIEAGDTTSGANGGELQNFLQFATFDDLNKNGTYDEGEPINVNQYNGGDGNGFTVAELSAAGWIPVADNSYPSNWLVEQTLPSGTTQKAGMLYCFGNFITSGTGAGTIVTGCDGSGNQNIAQTDGLTGSIEFDAVQTVNNDGFVCSSLNKVGASFADYSAPAAADCSATVASGDSIQTAIDGANPGDTICVAAGTYSGNVTVDQDVTVVALNAPDSAYSATIIGQVFLTADGAIFKGFNVLPGNVAKNGAGIKTTANNTTIDSNIVSGMTSDAEGSIKGIYVDKGSSPAISGSVVTNNYIHNLSLSTAHGAYGIMVQGVVDNTTVTDNTIKNLYANNGWGASGIEVTPTGSAVYAPKHVIIQYNDIETMGNGATESGKAITIDWYDAANVADASQVILSFNNFIDTALDVRNLDTVHTLYAPNNWWGDLSPATKGLVNTAPVAPSAYPLN